MKYAIPCVDGQICMHFGHREKFAVLEEKEGEIISTEMLTPPPHEPGVLPKWLHEQGADVIIAGGMGQRAQSLFAQNNIKVVTGAQSGSPEDIVLAYVKGSLVTGANACDH